MTWVSSYRMAGTDLLIYPMRVRDLVHGFVHLTKMEEAIISHSLFQRLRHIRQNDVAFFVYPSMNVTRLEHSVGCAHAAGKMAVNLMRSHYWKKYQDEVDLEPRDFLQLCRAYALLHDIGHLPLSHLFEVALAEYRMQHSPGSTAVDLCREWFGVDGFSKPHEALGTVLAQRIADDVRMDERLKSPLLRLVGLKTLPPDDPLRPIKLLVDSEIDADRIDSTARDGILAGGEYGTYDIERLCTAVFLHPSESGWTLAYSQKALSSLESLLLDRYRTHTWIHFHHRVIAVKCATVQLLVDLLARRDLSSSSFPVDSTEAMALRDDVWLWWLLRQIPEEDQSPAEKAARRLILYRDTSHVRLLWKRRIEYGDWQRQLKNAGLDQPESSEMGHMYEQWISDRLHVATLAYWPPFKPIGSEPVLLATGRGKDLAGILVEQSPLVESLRAIWEGEPQYYMVFLGATDEAVKTIGPEWLALTVEWLGRDARHD